MLLLILPLCASPILDNKSRAILEQIKKYNQSDILNCNILRPKNLETTALGAAYLAGLATGMYKDMKEVAKMREIEKIFVPSRTLKNVNKIYSGWKQAVAATRAFKPSDKEEE